MQVLSRNKEHLATKHLFSQQILRTDLLAIPIQSHLSNSSERMFFFKRKTARCIKNRCAPHRYVGVGHIETSMWGTPIYAMQIKNPPLLRRILSKSIMLPYFFAVCNNYPPKLSKRIMSSSTPREWRRSSTVFAIIGGPQR